MASYVPAGKTVRHWESEAQAPGPVRRASTQVSRSGSRRSYGSTWEPPVNFSRSGQILQGATGQYGNYLLYRDQVKYANERIAEAVAHDKDQELQKAGGHAINSMLGGPTAFSPGKQSARPGSVTTPSRLGAPRTNPAPAGNADAFGRVPKDQFGTVTGGGRQPAWQALGQPQTVAPQPVQVPQSQRGYKRPGLGSPVLEPGVSGIVGGSDRPEQLQMDFGQRMPHQPGLTPGNTSTRTETQRRDARAARGRPTGLNQSPTRRNPFDY